LPVGRQGWQVWVEWVIRAGRHAGSLLTGDKSPAPRPQTGHTPSRCTQY